MSPQSIDTGLREHAPLVRKIARQVLSKLTPNVEIDDLIQAGMIALADVLPRFDESHGAQFSTFASYRIRGAMIDEVRRMSERSRYVRKHERDIEGATRKLMHLLGRAPLESEVAEELELSLPCFQDLVDNVLGIGTVCIEDLQGEKADFFERHAGPVTDDPLNRLQDMRRRMALIKALGALSEHEQYLMNLYYEDALKLEEIGVLMGISQAWVGIQLARIITKLRIRLREH